jgi:hypothetical protein
LLGTSPSPMERIVACHVQVQHADQMAAQFERAGGRFAEG